MTPLLWAAGGTGFTFLMTTLGSAMVFLFRKEITPAIQKIFLGFAAGVMIAASVWSLLIPAIEEAQSAGNIGWIPAAGGFLLGVIFLITLDSLLPHLHPDYANQAAAQAEGITSSWKRTTLLVMAVTLHNIPEGMAVGLSFALAAQYGDNPALYTSAMALAMGIGIQNFPEGAAISLPLKQEGLTAKKSLFKRQHVRSGRTYLRDSHCPDRRFHTAFHAMAFILCRRSHDVRSCRGIDSGSSPWGTFQCRHAWSYGRLSDYDDS